LPPEKNSKRRTDDFQNKGAEYYNRSEKKLVNESENEVEKQRKHSRHDLFRKRYRMRSPKMKRKTIAFRIALLYTAFASAWIYLSDRLLEWFVPNPVLLTRLQTYKGWAFVAVTAVLLYSVLRSWFWKLEESQKTSLKADSQKRELSERLEHYLAASPTVTYALKVEDKTTRTIWVSENIERILDYTLEEALKPGWWAEHLHPKDREKALASLPLLFEKGSLIHEYRFLRKDGSVLFVRDELRLASSHKGDEQEIVGSWTDITELKEAENILVKQKEMLEKLNELSRLLGEDLTLEQSLERGMQILLSLSFSCLMQKGGIFLVDPEKKELVLKYSFNLPVALQRMCAHVPFGRCLCGRAANTGQMQYADRLDERHEIRYPGIEPHGHYSVPIIAGNSTLGVIVVYLPEKYPADSLEERFLLSAADIFAALINRKRAEAQIQEQLQTLSTLYGGAQRLSESLDLQERAHAATRTCVEGFGASLAWLGRAEPDGQVKILAQYPEEHPYPRSITVRWDDTPQGQGPTGRAIRSGTPQVTEDITTDPRFIPWSEAARQAGFYTAAAFPLISREQTFGALNLYNIQPGFFSSKRLEMFQAFAHLSASALENARLFEETQRRLKNIQALRNIDMAITGSFDPRVTFNVALDEITRQLGIDSASILRLNPYTQTLEYAAGRGFHTRTIEKTHLRMGEGLAGRAALEQRTVYVPNLSESSGFTRTGLFAEEGFTTYYAAPLITKGRVLGVLEIFHRSPHEGNSEWQEFLETLAGQTAIAIDNAELFHNLERSNIELVQAYEVTIEGWAYALDLKDEETEGHSRRVTKMTLRIAREMGVKEEELIHIQRGALLHDIGKMGIPDAILLKSGKLIDEEWEIMRKHPVYAYQMLSRIDYLRPALDIPYRHHEKWDGSGYPRGLKGGEIPLSARIFAVVDVFDALMSDRPYRKAWPKEKVLEYLREQSGKHFDPRVVEVFLTLGDFDHFNKKKQEESK